MELFSAGVDRTVKLWNASEGAYIDSLYGHLAPVCSLSALSKERVLSSSSDHTARLWKIPEGMSSEYSRSLMKRSIKSYFRVATRLQR